MKYLVLLAVIIITTIVGTVISIISSGSIIITPISELAGVFFGNLIFCLIQNGNMKRKILAWLLSSLLMVICSFFILNYLIFGINNIAVLIIAGFLIPLVVSWEVTRKIIPLDTVA